MALDRPPSDDFPRRPPAVPIPAPEPIAGGLAGAPPLPFSPTMAAPPDVLDGAPAAGNGAPAEKTRVVGKPFLPGNKFGGKRKQSRQWRREMARGDAWAPRVMFGLMVSTKTPSETRRRCAEFFVVMAHGRPVAPLSNADGSPLLNPGAGVPADDPIDRLLAFVRGGAATTATGSTEPENAPQGSDGDAPGGKAA